MALKLVQGKQLNTNLTGSFTGSFKGDGSQLTGVVGEWDGTLNGNAQITGSLSQGTNNLTIGDYSHAEGTATFTGITSAFATEKTDGILNGLVTLDSEYGDISSYFTQNGYLYIHYYDEVTDTLEWASYLITSISWDGTNTTIQLSDGSIDANQAYVGDITYLTNNGVFGGDSTIPGPSAHAEGDTTRAIGPYSHAEGQTTYALGIGSHAEGKSTYAVGNWSHAEGVGTRAIGNYSHAEGEYTQANGNSSHAVGLRTIAAGRRQHVQGMYNISSGQDGAFILGNGTAENNRSNLIFAANNSVEITGSLTVSGSNTFTNIGPAVFSGSINVTQGISGSLFGTASFASTASFVSLPTFTSGSVLFSNGTTIAQDNSNLFWDDTNNRLGIRRTPGVELDVSGDIRSTGTMFNTTTQTNTVQTNGSNLSFKGSGSTTYATMFLSTGNFVLQNSGTFTDAGYKLDVSGSARVSDISYLTLGARIGTTTTAAGIFPSGTSGRESLNLRSSLLPTDTGNDVVITNGQGDVGNTSSIRSLLTVARSFSPTSGTGIYNLIQVNPTINQTGGANGITRGLYINPTLTSAADFRAIETTAGNVLFQSGSTPLLFVSSSGNVGIGTSTPAYKLDVSGSTRLTSGSQLRVDDSSGGNYTRLQSRVIAFSRNSGTSEAVTIDGTSDNNLTIAARSNLILKGGGGNTTVLRINDEYPSQVGAGSVTITGVSTNNTSGSLYIQNSASTQVFKVFDGGSVAVGVVTNPSASLHISGASSAALLEIDSPASSSILFVSGSGNVGINTSTPAYPLHVNGVTGVRIDTSGTTALFINNTSGLIRWSNGSYFSSAGMYSGANNQIYETFDGTNVLTRLSIKANTGNVGINTTTDAGYKLDVSGSARISGTTTIAPTANTPSITSSTYLVTGSGTTPLLDLNGTVNTAGNVVPYIFDVTNTASGGGSFLVQFRRNGGYVLAIGLNDGLIYGTNYISATGAWNVSARENAINGVRFGSINSSTHTSGNRNHFNLTETFAPTSGTGTYSSIQSNPTINQTGGANGITRGLYINPTLTSASDFRAIETTRGNILFQSGSTPLLFVSESGNIGIGTTSSLASLHISGASSSNLLRIDSPASSSILFVSGSGNVGIGTSTPTNALNIHNGRLDISGTSTVGGNGLSMGYLSGTYAWIQSWISRPLALNPSGNNVTIGISGGADAGFKLDVYGTARVQGQTTLKGSGATSATTTFLIQNSTPTNLLSILDNGQVAFTSPTMSLAASQSAFSISPIISASAVVGGQYYGVNITPTFFQTTGSQTETAFRVAATYTGSSAAATGGTNIIADFGSTSAGSQLTVTDVTSGSIYMVNDVSGLPIIEATSDWGVKIYDFPRVVLEKTGSQVNINGTLQVSGSFILPLSQSATPQTGSAYWSGSLLFIYNGTRYMSASFF